MMTNQLWSSLQNHYHLSIKYVFFLCVNNLLCWFDNCFTNTIYTIDDYNRFDGNSRWAYNYKIIDVKHAHNFIMMNVFFCTVYQSNSANDRKRTVTEPTFRVFLNYYYYFILETVSERSLLSVSSSLLRL